VLDWHNVGYSLLTVYKVPTVVVWIAETAEFFFGRFASGHITVTKGLKAFLSSKGIEATVVYDRPSGVFKQSDDKALDRAYFEELLELDGDDVWLVSSTSWTPDEDIGLLLAAGDELTKRLEGQEARHLSIIITGKGSGRWWFEAEVKGRQYGNISFTFTYFDDYDEYARFLGCCDIGISLHVSSSGFDLPMKGLDMIGSGLPVLSVRYPCIGELVEDGTNGILFGDGVELAAVLSKMLVTNEISMENLKKGSVAASELRWDQEWLAAAQPVLFPGT
jgi:beta-1,4-mannosyltransferase